VIFSVLSPGDVSVTAIAAHATKPRTHPPACCRPQRHASLSSRFKMPLPPPMLQPLLFGHCNLSSGHHPLFPPLPAAVLLLLLLPVTACLYCSHQWLVVVSFLAPSSAAHSVVCCSHHCAIDWLANLKETRKVKGACRVEATSITTVFKE
jgi:hypothetical protein